MGRVGLDDRRRQTALLVMLLYPYGGEKGSSLFGVVCGNTLLHAGVPGRLPAAAEARRWWLAGLLAVAATAEQAHRRGHERGPARCWPWRWAEPSGGVPELVGLFARWRVPVRVQWRELRLWQVGPAVLSLAGLAAYSGYLWNFGRPAAVRHGAGIIATLPGPGDPC